MKHYDGDGCAGESRHIGPEEQQVISICMGDMMMAYTRRDGAGLVNAGAYIGMHFGPDGEWALALRLSHQVRGLCGSSDCDADGVPVLHRALDHDDERLLLVVVHCIQGFPEVRDHTRAEVEQAVAAAMPLVQDFIGHIHHDRKPEAYAAWEYMYDVSAGTTITRESILRAGACSALLTGWAARYSVSPVDTAPL